MNTTIHGKDRPIRKVFREDYDLEIPPYQRPYSWSEEEAGDLFSDLYQEVKGSSRKVNEIDPYFLGSLVLIKEEGNPKSEVVDGQQRLTTLTILFSALRNHVSEDYADALDKRIMEEGDPLTDQDENVRLSIRERDRQFFKEHIQDQLDSENLFGGLGNTANHQSNHGCTDYSLRHFRKTLVVSNQAAISSEPAECTLNYPSFRKRVES